jgi:Ca-activated chloride channel family protein
MSRTDEARQFLESWDPDQVELPDWIVDEIEGDPSLAALFDRRFVPWEAGELGQRPAAARPGHSWRGLMLGVVGPLAAAAGALLALAPRPAPEPEPPMMSARQPESGRFRAAALDTGAPPPPANGADFHGAHASHLLGGKADESRITVQEWTARTRGSADGTVTIIEGQNAGKVAPRSEGYFSRTAQDALSTFSIDVDTASYSMVRRKLREGYLPPAAAVRVEEFVNAFPYDYPRPPDDAPFGVSFEGAPSPSDPGAWLVRVGVQGRRVPADQRRAVHLTFLVDTSGSMQSDDKIGLVKYALRELTGELVDGDTVSIVAYAGSAGVVLPPTPMSERPRVYASLDQLAAGGSTAMGAGIELAYRLAQETYQDGAVNRVIILSDGDANVGPTSPEALVSLVRRYALQGITLTVAGFGEGNYQDDRMEQLADQGDGNYFYIDSQQQAQRVFVDQLTSTLVEIARDVKIQVQWDPQAVSSYRLLGYENRDIADQDFRDDAVDAGEIGSGHRVTALYEVKLAPGRAPSSALARVSVRNKAPGPDSPAVERTFTMTVEALRPSLSETGAGFRIAVAAACFAERLRGSPHLHALGLREIEEIARGAQRPEYPEDAELLSLIQRARQLAGE